MRYIAVGSFVRAACGYHRDSAIVRDSISGTMVYTCTETIINFALMKVISLEKFCPTIHISCMGLF